jgi:hypothetical protein
VEENGGKWGMEHSLRGRRNAWQRSVQTNPVPKPLYHIKFYLSNIKHIKIWANMSQILISKCYNFAQKSYKSITKSYKTYGKYSKKFQNFQGFFK